MRNFLKRMRDQRHKDPYSKVLNGWSTREKFRLVGQRWCVRTACVCVSKHVWVCWCACMVEFVCVCVCDRRERACLLHLLLSSYSSSIVRRVRKRTCRQLIGPGLAVKTDCRNFFPCIKTTFFDKKTGLQCFSWSVQSQWHQLCELSSVFKRGVCQQDVFNYKPLVTHRTRGS